MYKRIKSEKIYNLKTVTKNSLHVNNTRGKPSTYIFSFKTLNKDLSKHYLHFVITGFGTFCNKQEREKHITACTRVYLVFYNTAVVDISQFGVDRIEHQRNINEI